MTQQQFQKIMDYCMDMYRATGMIRFLAFMLQISKQYSPTTFNHFKNLYNEQTTKVSDAV